MADTRPAWEGGAGVGSTGRMGRGKDKALEEVVLVVVAVGVGEEGKARDEDTPGDRVRGSAADIRLGRSTSRDGTSDGRP